MRPRLSIILLLSLSAPLMAATEAARNGQVISTTAKAVDAINHEIGNQPWGADGTIQDYLQRTHSEAALRAWLDKSQPVGGPRWLDDKTCQVRIEVDGDKVADWLTSRANAQLNSSSTHPDTREHELDDLRTHRFEATSTSTASDSANILTPSNTGSNSQSISAAERRAVISAARQNAAEHLLTTLGPIEVTEGRTVTDVMASKPALREQLLAYLRTAPITNVDFQDNRQAQVQLGPSGEELAEIIYTSAEGKTSAELDAGDYRNLQALHERIAQHMGEVTGSASLATTNQTPAAAPMIPAQPPAWIDQQLDAVGHGFVAGSQLRSAHAAEHDAVLKLRTRLGELHLDDSHTVLDAAAHDPHVADAINQTLEQARPYKSEFNADGSVTTHEILDLHDFWQALSASP